MKMVYEMGKKRSKNRKKKDSYISFSEKVKNEYSELDISDRKIEAVLELAGIYRMNSSIALIDNDFQIKFTTRSKGCIKRVVKLVKSIYDEDIEILELNDLSLNKNNTYIGYLNSEITKDFLSISGFDLLGDFSDSKESFISRLKNKEHSISYLRGAFLGGGSITDPNKGYNLEIIGPKEVDGDIILALLENIGIKGNIRNRKDRLVIYVKNSEDIGEFLAETNATNAYLEYINVRIEKSTINNFNRAANFETSNLDKQLETSARQIAYLNYIENNIGLENIPENLREVAILRRENEDKSIKEIGEMLNPPLSKSGVNYRLKKLENIAKDHMGNRKG